MTLLSVSDLTRTFGGLVAVDHVSLGVEAGERRAIIGPNGAGKTTLFNLISGELAATEGRIVFAGQEITDLAVHRRAQLGLGRTFQRNSLMPNLTVLENVRLAVQAQSRPGLLTPISVDGALQQRAAVLVDEFRLTERGDVLARNLAYGDQRRLEIAMAMAMQPQLLLLDEPTAGMSMGDVTQFLEWTHALPRSITLLIIEHDMDVVFDLADRVTVLHYGQVLADGSPDEVRHNPRVMEVYLGQDAEDGNRIAGGANA